MGFIAILLDHPEEIPALLKLKIAAMRVHRLRPKDPDLAFCYDMLERVSRSFAIVIQQLGPELRNAVCIFYLVLRALDTVEDDMSIPVDKKLPILKSLHKSIYDPSWCFICGEKDYKVLMECFHHVSVAFLRLAKRYQDTIEEIACKMGNGMAKFICQEVETIEEYDEYCHYVAGLVGLGLSRLFHAADLEELAPDSLSNSMGLFLQKTNIIRDYLEDINEIPRPRMFWPREIWGEYVQKLEDFKKEENTNTAVACLNHMITNALVHALDCLKYMSVLHDHAIFRFCAIPQIMAMGTLAVCYNNKGVFRGVVKLRRGLTAKIMDQTQCMADVYGAFFDFCGMLALKIDKNDPSYQKTLDRIEEIEQACRASNTLTRRRMFVDKRTKTLQSHLVMFILVVLLVFCVYSVGKELKYYFKN